MYKKIFLFSFASALIIACTPKASKSVSSAANSTPPAVVTAPVAPVPAKDPNEILLTVAKPRFPDITADKLNQGRSIYYGGACINCHAAENIAKYDEKQWFVILNDMASKAQLSANEKDAVWKFIIAVTLAAK